MSPTIATRPAGVREGAVPVQVIEYAPVPVYAFADLVGDARKKALETLREYNTGEGCLEGWADSCQEDLAAVGFTIKRREPRTRPDGTKTRGEPCFWYSLSYCQGDGTAFEGRLSLQAFAKAHGPGGPMHGAKRALPKDFPKLAAEDLKLLRAWLRKEAKALGGDPTAQAVVSHRSNYTHDRSMEVEVSTDAPDLDVPAPLGKALSEWVSAASRWFTKAGYEELDYLAKEETCAESAEANGYTFTAAGEREG